MTLERYIQRVKLIATHEDIPILIEIIQTLRALSMGHYADLKAEEKIKDLLAERFQNYEEEDGN